MRQVGANDLEVGANDLEVAIFATSIRERVCYYNSAAYNLTALKLAAIAIILMDLIDLMDRFDQDDLSCGYEINS